MFYCVVFWFLCYTASHPKDHLPQQLPVCGFSKALSRYFLQRCRKKKTPLFAQRVNIFGSDKAGNSLIINTSPFMRFLPQHAMPEAIELLKSCKTMAPSSKANNAKKLLLLEISYFLRTENTTKPYILKAKKFAEPPFQSKKNCGKSA